MIMILNMRVEELLIMWVWQY